MILWLLKKDIQLVSLTPEKSIQTVADVMCGVSRDRGITEVRMLDHDITAKVQARMVGDGSVLQRGLNSPFSSW